MIDHEIESQLSAMFDGELPAAECELLSRRIDRDENLRARWSRYALIGAAMRSEPVATARQGFAVRVSAALAADDLASPRAAPAPAKRGLRNRLWNVALAATLVASVAGLSVSMLRDAAQQVDSIATLDAPTMAVALGSAMQPATAATAVNRRPSGDAFDVSTVAAAPTYRQSPIRYVTPSGTPGAAAPGVMSAGVATPGASTVLRTQLADYIVAHSAYSTPLLRRNVLSELVTSEDQMGIASSYPELSVAAHGSPTADASR